MINLSNLSISYTEGEKIISDLSLIIEPNCTLGIVGPNGAGKTTLFKAMLGLLPFDGQINIADIQLNKKTVSKIRQMVGYVSQNSDDSLFMPTVLEDMIFGPVNYGMAREDAIREAKEICSSLGMDDPADMYNYKLSGGVKRMASIATAMAMKPEVYIMDEPSSNLDPKNRRRMINILRDINATKIIATHDLDMVLDICDRVVILNHGTIVADGEPLDILGNKTLLEKNDLELPFCLAGMTPSPRDQNSRRRL